MKSDIIWAHHPEWVKYRQGELNNRGNMYNAMRCGIARQCSYCKLKIRASIYIYKMYVYIYIYVCVCVCARLYRCMYIDNMVKN